MRKKRVRLHSGAPDTGTGLSPGVVLYYKDYVVESGHLGEQLVDFTSCDAMARETISLTFHEEGRVYGNDRNLKVNFKKEEKVSLQKKEKKKEELKGNWWIQFHG